MHRIFTSSAVRPTLVTGQEEGCAHLGIMGVVGLEAETGLAIIGICFLFTRFNLVNFLYIV